MLREIAYLLTSREDIHCVQVSLPLSFYVLRNIFILCRYALPLSSHALEYLMKLVFFSAVLPACLQRLFAAFTTLCPELY